MIRFSLKKGALLALAMCLSAPIMAGAPSGYYDSVDTASASTARSTIHDIIDGHTRYPYTSTATDCWDIIAEAHEDPNNSSNILDIYKNESYMKIEGGTGDYNREHCWPKSYGFPDYVTSNIPYTDLHHLMACDSNYNSSRSNKPYDESDGTEYVTVENNGVGGGGGDESNYTDGAYSAGSWQVWTGRRGDVARALLYMDVRYEGDSGEEPDLILTDDRDLIDGCNTGDNEDVAYMGVLSVLLQWNVDDPVDDIEMDHNDVVYSYQGNRNPFIDHPEWVETIFGGPEYTGGGGGNTGTGTGTGTTEGDCWINEFHYDNDGTDTDEFIEIAGPSGTSLADWQVLCYNGNGGAVYDTISLSGTISGQSNGFGTLSFSNSGIQNGPDGFALVDADGEVVEFISYEGSFEATDGAADGVTSTQISVSETSSTTSGYSLQLGGEGSASSDFTWQSAMTGTPGSVNTNQSFTGTGSDTTAPGEVSSLTVTAGDAQAALIWTNPTDSDFAGVVIRSSTSGFPSSETSGAAVYNGTGASVTDTGLTNGTTYYYMAFTYDESGNYSDGVGVGATPAAVSSGSGEIWINEIHYDNDGADTGEFVEIAGEAGVDVTGWQILAYNGNGGAVYKTTTLSGTIPSQQNGYGTLSFSMSGLQNGASDGLALVDDSGDVIEFISYEGTLTATDGAASGTASIDIGVSESSSTASGYSLQLGGSGNLADDFTWQSAMTDTPGSVNTNQTLTD